MKFLIAEYICLFICFQASPIPVILLLISNLEVAWTANILAYFPIDAMSHTHLKSTLLRELATRGHNITVVSPLAEENPPPNYEEIMISDHTIITQKYGKPVTFIYFNSRKKNKNISYSIILHYMRRWVLTLTEYFDKHFINSPLILIFYMK